MNQTRTCIAGMNVYVYTYIRNVYISVYVPILPTISEQDYYLVNVTSQFFGNLLNRL